MKIIVTDLDQTLLRTDKTISPYTLKVFNKCKEMGIIVGIATARSEKAAEQYIDLLRPDIIISNGGSKATYNNKLIYERLLSVHTSDLLIQNCLLNNNVGGITVEAIDGYYCNYTENLYPDYTHAIYNDFVTPLNKPTYKITVEIFDENSALSLSNQFSECNFLSFTGESWYRFAHKDATKYKAILEISRCLNVLVKDIAAFGDDFNDIEMIKHCGTGVAVSNALKNVKDVADFICGSNDNDGVAKWIAENMI